jgi:hypothetical protein
MDESIKLEYDNTTPILSVDEIIKQNETELLTFLPDFRTILKLIVECILYT